MVGGHREVFLKAFTDYIDILVSSNKNLNDISVWIFTELAAWFWYVLRSHLRISYLGYLSKHICINRAKAATEMVLRAVVSWRFILNLTFLKCSRDTTKFYSELGRYNTLYVSQSVFSRRKSCDRIIVMSPPPLKKIHVWENSLS